MAKNSGNSTSSPAGSKTASGKTVAANFKVKSKTKKAKKKRPVTNFLIATTAFTTLIGSLGAGYYTQFLDPYEQQQLKDQLTGNPDRIKADGTRMTLEEHQALTQTVPMGYQVFSEIRYEALQDGTRDIPGYNVIDMTSASGQQKHYQNLLSKLPDTNPIIAALQTSPDHSAEDIAKEFVENDGLSSLSGAPLSERMAVQTAVILSLKLGEYDDLADIAYTNMMNDYAVFADTARVQAENAIINEITPQMVVGFDDLNDIIWERKDIAGQQYTEIAHAKREEAYLSMSTQILQGFGMDAVSLFLLNQSTIDGYTGTTNTDELPTGFASLDPTTDGEEALFINYDDLTIGRDTPTFMQPELQQRDFHQSIDSASDVIGSYTFKAYTDGLSEKLLSGQLDAEGSEYAYALVSTVQATVNISDDVKSSAPNIIENAAQDFGQRFGSTYQEWYKKVEQAENDYINGKRKTPDLDL
jgi:hypothetical protein